MRRAQKQSQFGIMAVLRRLGLVKKKKALPMARAVDPEEELYSEPPSEDSSQVEQTIAEPSVAEQAPAMPELEAPPVNQWHQEASPPEREPAAESLRAFASEVRAAEVAPAVPESLAPAEPPAGEAESSAAPPAAHVRVRRLPPTAPPELQVIQESAPEPAPEAKPQQTPPAPVQPPAAAETPKSKPPALPIKLKPKPGSAPRQAPSASGGGPIFLDAATVASAPGAGDIGIEAEDKRHWLQRYWRRVGAGSLALSIGIHVLAIVIAILVVTTTSMRQTVDFLPGGGSKGSGEATADLAHQVQAKRRRALDAAPKQRVISNSSLSTIKLPDLPLDRPEMPPVSNLLMANNAAGMGQAGAGGGFGNGTGIGGQNGFTSLPPMMRSRCGNVERLSKLKESGGSVESEAAVNRALQWLKTQQHPDGSWGKTYKCAMTGFALLCYLGHCETPDSPAYGHQVMQGLLYLMEMQRANRYAIFSTSPRSIQSTYEHGICTYAVGEMYTLARLGNRQLPGMREAFEDGVKVIIDNQMGNGSWSYGLGGAIGYDKRSRDADLSVTGWQYQALKAARYTGLPIRGLNGAIDKTVKYIESTQTQDGGFGVRERLQGYNQWNLTGTAVLGLQTLGHGDNVQIDKGVKFAVGYFTDEPPQWSKNANLYCWYYYSHAFFQYGGAVWKGWNDRLLPQLVEHQAKDGSWNEEVYNSELGSTAEALDDTSIYRATLCTLMLEVYYRYLKVGDRQSGSVFNRN